MQESNAQTSTVIESSNRQFTHGLSVDWNNDGLFEHPLSDMSAYVVSTSRDQTISSTAPDEVMLVEGYSAGALTVEATGQYNGIPLAGHFAPYNGRSIFYTEGLQLGVTMVYAIAVWTDEGWEWFRQFTGVVRDVSADRETGGITLECLDFVENMRTSVDIPPYALWESYLKENFKRSGLVDSSSIIDLAARSGNFTMGPHTRWAHYKGSPRGSNYGPILSVPFHGSILPEIGMLDNVESFHRTEEWENNTALKPRAEAYTYGPHGYLAHNAVPTGYNDWNFKKFWIDEWNKQAGTLFGTWVMGIWVYWTGNGVDENSVVMDCQIRANHLQLYVRGDDGGVEVRVKENDGYISWSNTPLKMSAIGWHYIEGRYLVYGGDRYTLQVRVDDTISSEIEYSGRNAYDVNDRLSGLVVIENKFAISDAYVVKNADLVNFGGFSYDRTPADTARVSWGRNRIAYTLRESGLEAWDLAKDVASAEYGVVYFDEFGRFIFWNFADVTSRQSQPVRTFTIDNLEKLSLRNTFDSVRNVWTVTTQTARAYTDIAYDLKNGVPFTLSDNGELIPANFQLPAFVSLGDSRSTFWFNVDDHTISLNPNDLWDSSPKTWDGFWEDTVPTHALKSYSFTTFHDQPPHSEQKMTTRTLARLAMSNGLDVAVGFLLINDPSRPQDGQPRFRIEGTIVHEDEPYTWSIRDESSIAEYGERVIQLDNNFWLQDEYQTRAMLADIVSRMGRPIPVSDQVTVPGDPRIQLGDLVQVQDSDGFGEQTWLQVYGIQRELDADNGLTDTYTIEAVKTSGEGVWDSETYGLWDQSLIWQ